MKTLLVPVAMHDALPSVFETTRLAATRFGSLIEGVSLRPALAEYVPVDMVGGMTWLRDEEADLAEAEEAGSRFVAAMDAAGIPRHPRDGLCNPEKVMEAGPRYRWRRDVPTGDAFLGQYARLFSATVVGRPGSGDDAPRMTTFETALFESGRPILLAPPAPPASLGEAVLIAWNGSTETARAVAFAMPFLRRAARVLVLSVEGAWSPARARRTSPRPWPARASTPRTGRCRPGGGRRGRPSWRRRRSSAATSSSRAPTPRAACAR